MPRIRCHYINCVFVDDTFCGAAAVEIDPDEGCMTYSPADGISDEDWDDDDIEEWNELETDDDDLWLDDDNY